MNTIQEINSLIESGEITQAQLSKESGLSESIWSATRKGYYKGDIDNVERVGKGFLVKYHEKKAEQPLKITFEATTTANKVIKTAKSCHLNSKIGVYFGKPGLGKTTAIKEYAKNNPDVIVIEVSPGDTKKIFIRELHKALGFDGVSTFYQMRNDITSRLKNSGRLVIVDETEKLNHVALDTLRRIHDKTDYTFGILLIGTPELYHNLRGRKGEYQYLSSRILYNIELEALIKEDVEKIVLQVFPKAGNLVETFYQYSEGKTRFLCNLIELVETKKRESGLELSKELIRDVAEYIACFY